MKFACLFGLLTALGSARAAPALALGANESLLYHVAWVVIPGAGEIRVSAHPATDTHSSAQLRIVSTTATRGLARLLLSFDARAESLFDTASGRLLWLGESSETNMEKAAHTVVFDYAKRTANYTNSLIAGPVRALPMPAGNPTDLITCLLSARTWNLRPGEQHDALVLFNDDFYLLTVHARGYETLTTSMGTFHTVVLEPRMEKTPPLGMFKRGSTVRVWISQDAQRLPVRFKVQFKFGSGIATLTEYHPPTR
jgi:hypothetical protein